MKYIVLNFVEKLLQSYIFKWFYWVYTELDLHVCLLKGLISLSFEHILPVPQSPENGLSVTIITLKNLLTMCVFNLHTIIFEKEGNSFDDSLESFSLRMILFLGLRLC